MLFTFTYLTTHDSRERRESHTFFFFWERQRNDTDTRAVNFITDTVAGRIVYRGQLYYYLQFKHTTSV